MSDPSVLQKLQNFIAIESVSADPGRRNHIAKAVDFIKSELESLGFSVRVLENKTFPPLVFAVKNINQSAKTIGVYAHYDVQPEDPVDEWKTPPFQLTHNDGTLIGRGVADDKGHLIQTLAALKKLTSTQTLKNNIVCIFEGEEETGSPHFEEYLNEIRNEMNDLNALYIFDMGMYRKNEPQIYYGLRGLIYCELEIVTSNRDLHSGSYGNKVLNPALVAAQLFAKMKDSLTNKVTIPGFYDDVADMSGENNTKLLEIARSDEEEMKEAGTTTLISVDSMHSFLSTKILPSLDINGIVSGYIGEGAKTIIPSKATIKFSCRLVEHQDPDKVLDEVSNFIKNNLPHGATHTLKVFSKDAPFFTSLDNEYVKSTTQILEKTFDSKIIYNRSGGSIAAAEIFQRLLGKPIILTGFILPDCKLHSPNENYDEEMFWKGITVIEQILNQD